MLKLMQLIIEPRPRHRAPLPHLFQMLARMRKVQNPHGIVPAKIGETATLKLTTTVESNPTSPVQSSVPLTTVGAETP
jgi:hypothetical protein